MGLQCLSDALCSPEVSVLCVPVASDDPHNIQYIVSLHTNDVIKCGIFFSTHLACMVITTRDTFLAEFLLRTAVDWVSILLVACTGRIDDKIGLQTGSSD